MSDESEVLHDKLANRFRALKATTAFFDKPPKAVLDVLRLFDCRQYAECKKKTGELINAGVWVAFGSLVANGCDELMAMQPLTVTPMKVEVARK